MLQSCLTLGNPMNHSLPGSSLGGILQARILEWVARVSSWPRDRTVSHVSCIGTQVLDHWRHLGSPCQLTQSCISSWKCLKIIRTHSLLLPTVVDCKNGHNCSLLPMLTALQAGFAAPPRKSCRLFLHSLNSGCPSDLLGPEECSGCYLYSSEPRPWRNMPASSLSGTQVNGQARLPENDSPRGAGRAAPTEATADQWPPAHGAADSSAWVSTAYDAQMQSHELSNSCCFKSSVKQNELTG